MNTVSGAPGIIRAGSARPSAVALKPTLLSLASALCGALMQAKIDLGIGDLVVGELLLIVVALFVLMLQGIGHRVNRSSLWLFGAAAFIMLLGYVASDLYSATAPEQFLRGWARVSVLGLDILALLIVVSRGDRNFWWFALGLAVGAFINLVVTLPPFTMSTWKVGYSAPIVILLALLAGFWGKASASVLFAVVGIFSVYFDYRSLGGLMIAAAAILMAQVRRDGRRQKWPLRAVVFVASLTAACAILTITLVQSDTEFGKRRYESNVGRYVGMVVAVQAIADSPLVGYGSWAGDKHYAALLNQELARAVAGTDIRLTRWSSILPHSQLLMAWVEGGLFGAQFFLIYGWQMLLALYWLMLRHVPGRLTPLYLVFVTSGLWDLAASPFLGPHRITILCAIATLALLNNERNARKGGAAMVPAVADLPNSVVSRFSEGKSAR